MAERQLAEARAYLAKARARHRLRVVIPALAVAATLVLGVLFGPSWWPSLWVETYRTAVGERKTVALRDGSGIELNTDTELTVRLSERARKVALTRGEALFTVVHDQRKPFEVFAHRGCIRDTGTVFDVRAEAERVSVFVIEGAVSVTAEGSRGARALQSGERLAYNTAGDVTATERLDVGAASAWREGRLVFKGRPLAEVIAELGRYHRATVMVITPRLKAIPVSGVFPTGDLKLALATIAAALPVTLTEVNSQLCLLDQVEARRSR
ncbi:MAG: FecR family protein [Gammaproteobacteria bacterium]